MMIQEKEKESIAQEGCKEITGRKKREKEEEKKIKEEKTTQGKSERGKKSLGQQQKQKNEKRGPAKQKYTYIPMVSTN